MNAARRILAVSAALLMLLPKPARSQFIVHNLLEAAQIAKEIIEQAKHFAEELKQFSQEVKQILKRAEQWKMEEKTADSQYNIFEKIRKLQYDYLDDLKRFRRRAEKDFPWEALKLKEIEDILASPFFRAIAGDPYQAMFTQGTGVSSVFPELKYRDNIYQSGQYKNNGTLRKLFDDWIQEEDRMIQDLEIRKNAMAGVNRLQVESEDKLKKFERTMIDLSQMAENATWMKGKYTNLSELLAWNTEMNLELAREFLQQIIVKKTMLEARILKKVRELYQEKLEAAREGGGSATPERKDGELVTNLLKGSK